MRTSIFFAAFLFSVAGWAQQPGTQTHIVGSEGFTTIIHGAGGQVTVIHKPRPK
jgi:hypothetical protein